MADADQDLRTAQENLAEQALTRYLDVIGHIAQIKTLLDAGPNAIGISVVAEKIQEAEEILQVVAKRTAKRAVEV